MDLAAGHFVLGGFGSSVFSVLWSYLLKKIGPGSGLMQIGKSKAKVYIEKKTGVTFADVAGIAESRLRMSAGRAIILSKVVQY